MTIGSDNMRSFYRLSYPVGDRPKLYSCGKVYEVSDVSEQGLKIFKIGNYVGSVKDNITGEIEFGDRNRFSVEAKIIRITKESVVLKLSSSLPLKHIMEEQRYLINNYGKSEL